MGEAARLLGIDLELREEEQGRAVYDNKILEEKIEQQHTETIPKPSNKTRYNLKDSSSRFPLLVKPETIKVKQEQVETNEECQIQGNKLTRFKCQFCNKTLKNLISLRKHKHKKHPDCASRGDVLCTICSKFIHKKFLSRHVKKKHPGVVYDFNEKSLFEKHGNVCEDLKDDNNGLLCKFCSRMFKTRKSARRHKQIKHPNMKSPGDVSCGFCPQSVGRGQLNQHMKFKHPEEHSGRN